MAFRDIVPAAGTLDPTGIAELTGGGDVLVLAPHPDDETLGCGGAISAAVAAGTRVHVVIVTNGARSHPNSAAFPPARIAALRAAEATRAVAILTAGAERPIFLGYPDCAAPSDAAGAARVADRLSDVLRATTAVWTTWEGDPHVDHESTARLATRLCRGAGARHLAFPVWGRVGGEAPCPDRDRLIRFATAPHRPAKAQALAAHRSQMTRMIDDDPEGFLFPEELARHFIASDEIFIRVP